MLSATPTAYNSIPISCRISGVPPLQSDFSGLSSALKDDTIEPKKRKETRTKPTKMARKKSTLRMTRTTTDKLSTCNYYYNLVPTTRSRCKAQVTPHCGEARWRRCGSARHRFTAQNFGIRTLDAARDCRIPTSDLFRWLKAQSNSTASS